MQLELYPEQSLTVCDLQRIQGFHLGVPHNHNSNVGPLINSRNLVECQRDDAYHLATSIWVKRYNLELKNFAPRCLPCVVSEMTRITHETTEKPTLLLD